MVNEPHGSAAEVLYVIYRFTMTAQSFLVTQKLQMRLMRQ